MQGEQYQMTPYSTTTPLTADLMPTTPDEQAQRLADELRARTSSQIKAIELVMPDSPARARLIAEHRATEHALIEMLTVLRWLCYRQEHALEEALP
jgi:hypothetical protein